MMEEQIQMYRAFEPWKRSLIMVILGLILPVFIFYDEGARVEEELSKIETKATTARGTFSDSTKKKDKIAELSANLESTKTQLELATQLLPDEFLMDEILQATAETAADLDITLDQFAPGERAKPLEDVRYEEMPISIKVTGSFNKIAVFFDRLVHLDKLVHLRGMRITAQKFDPKVIPDWNILTPQQRAKKAGERAIVISEAKMIVFRGLK